MTGGVSWKSLILCPNQLMSGALVETLGRSMPQGAALQVPSYPPEHALVEILATHQPTVCFLDVGSDADRAAATITEIVASHPKLPLVALLPAMTLKRSCAVSARGRANFDPAFSRKISLRRWPSVSTKSCWPAKAMAPNRASTA